jgi:phosphopantetheinyl transferase (holo-ACP synthase)
MIYGIGTDICDVRRIRASLERMASALPKVLSRCRAGHLARAQRALARARHALPGHALFGQGAFSKAIGLGMHMPMTWRACEVILPSGQPSSCCMAASGVVRGTVCGPPVRHR